MRRQTDSTAGGSPKPAPEPAVVYFAKAPIPGRVKTRLCPPLTEVEAAALYAAFLRELVVPVAGARTLVYGWPAEELERLRPLMPDGIELRAQRGADLWERMTACIDELCAEGHRPVLIRNTDSPDLPLARVTEGIQRCRAGSVVLGPDAGGGYYLLALWAPCSELFTGQIEGGSTVYSQTVQRAGELGLRVESLATERDVDTFDDLVAMWRARGASTEA